MIANFAALGEMYQHRDYDTVGTPWNAYPWHIGSDNFIREMGGQVEHAEMYKTIWRIDEHTRYFRVVKPRADVGNIFMFTALVSMDQWGNFGRNAGNDPEVIPSDYMAPVMLGGRVFGFTSERAMVEADSREETVATQGFIGMIGGQVFGFSTTETLIVRDSNKETTNDIAPVILSASLSFISSNAK